MSSVRFSPAPLIFAVLTVAGVVLGLRAFRLSQPSPASPTALPVPRNSGGSLGKASDWSGLLRRRGRVQAAQVIDDACAPQPTACLCRWSALGAAVDLPDPAFAEEVMVGLGGCEPRQEGLWAEALALAGRQAEARMAARAVLEREPQDAHSLLALARLSSAEQRFDEAAEQASAAVGAGRGTPALLLSFLLELARGRREAAAEALSTLRSRASGHPDVLYAEALLEHFDDHYGAARRGYLLLLRLDPEHADARFQLGRLTHSVGAVAEAQHNLSRLKGLVGESDPRVVELQAILSGPPAPTVRRFVFAPGDHTPPAGLRSLKPNAGVVGPEP